MNTQTPLENIENSLACIGHHTPVEHVETDHGTRAWSFATPRGESVTVAIKGDAATLVHIWGSIIDGFNQSIEVYTDLTDVAPVLDELLIEVQVTADPLA